MIKDIEKFVEKTQIKNKDFAIYEDKEKGILFIFNTVQMFARVDYLELDKKQYETAKFQNKIDNLEYNTINIKRPVPKNEITGKEEDKTTLVDKEIVVRQVWNVINALGIYKSFANKEEALNLAHKINEIIFTNM